MNPSCSDCHHVRKDTDDTARCGQYRMTNGPTPLYAPVAFARSLPRLLAWVQGECGKSGRYFKAKYPF